MCWAGSGGSQAGVGTGSVTLAMSSEAVSRRGRGRGQSLSLLWLLLLPPLATRGLRGSLPMATPALAPGETLEGGAPTPSAQPLARGAPGTVQGRRALCGVNALHCWAGAWADCGWRPVPPGYPSFFSLPFPPLGSPAPLDTGGSCTPLNSWDCGTPLNSSASGGELPQDLWVGP